MHTPLYAQGIRELKKMQKIQLAAFIIFMRDSQKLENSETTWLFSFKGSQLILQKANSAS
jgi:hypothetical protein